MTIYAVSIGASIAGSIGTKYYEKRTYRFEIIGPLDHWEMARDLAIEKAYSEGLEHVRVEHITPRPAGHPKSDPSEAA